MLHRCHYLHPDVDYFPVTTCQFYGLSLNWFQNKNASLVLLRL